MKTLIIGMVLAAGVLTGCARADSEQGEPAAAAESTLWLTNYEQALKVATEKNRPVLVDFTGSDWCGWCIKLDKEVFSKDAFKAYARDNLVLLKLDFPRRKMLPKEKSARNQELAEIFGIRGFPTIVLLGADGKEKARTGYQRGGAEAYVEHLKGLLD